MWNLTFGKNIECALEAILFSLGEEVEIEKLAEALETTVEYLLGNDGLLIADAYERGGAKTARDINALVSEISGLFAGGDHPRFSGKNA